MFSSLAICLVDLHVLRPLPSAYLSVLLLHREEKQRITLSLPCDAEPFLDSAQLDFSFWGWIYQIGALY